MQLVRSAQSKHKINLLALSTEDGGPYVVATWYVVLIVCSSCVPLNSNTNTSSHSPRRTGGPQAPASGACKFLLLYSGRTIYRLSPVRENGNISPVCTYRRRQRRSSCSRNMKLYTWYCTHSVAGGKGGGRIPLH